MVYMEIDLELNVDISQGNFAFLCESAMLDYFVQQDCNLTQIGGLLDSKVSS